MYPEGRTEEAHVVTELSDGSVIQICKNTTLFSEAGVPQLALTWVHDNPGGQLMTSSFHPIADDVRVVLCGALDVLLTIPHPATRVRSRSNGGAGRCGPTHRRLGRRSRSCSSRLSRVK